MKRLLIVLVLIAAVCAGEQPPRQLVDRALEQLGMQWSDVVLPSDLTSRDKHRLDAVEQVFRDPFALVSVAERFNRYIDMLRQSPDGAQLAWLVRECNYRPSAVGQIPQEWTYYPRDKNDSVLLRTSLIYQSIVQQYLVPIATFLGATLQTRKLLRTNPTLYAHSDSLWLLSSEDENADPYQLYAAQLRSDSIAREFFDQAVLVDLGPLLSHALALYSQIATILERTRDAHRLFLDSIRTIEWDTPLGRCAIGGPEDNVYRGDYAFIFDVGGNDTYHLETTKERAFERGVQVIIDLAGNDLYVGSNYTLGAGIAGCGILIDESGDDTYRGGSFSLGCGLWGFGIVHDWDGSDSYSGAICTQAAAAFGIGVLLDRAGNDHYTAYAHGQAFAGTRAAAILADINGNDHYITASPFVDVLRYDSHYLAFTQGAALGYRPIASGGIALLCDRAGNDVYTSDIYGQGTAYWFGIGILDDHKGEDRYIAYQYAQGAGIHFAHGLLWDRSGNDLYTARGVSQGCGHDVGVGMLLDDSGDDAYVVESLSLGGGNANAVSIFVDHSGDDAYITRNESNTRGYSDLRRGLPMVGIFVDGGGRDRYGRTSGNASSMIKSTFGIALDTDDSTAWRPSAAERASTAPPALPYSLDSLFILASTAPQKYQYLVAPARSAIVERGTEAIGYIASKLGTSYPRQRLALEDIIPRLYQRDSNAVRRLLQDSLRSQQRSTVLFCLWAVGKCRIESLADSVATFLRHEDWRVRAAAAQQIGEGKFRRVAAHLAALVSDEHPWVRARAAFALAAVEGIAARTNLVRFLRDTASIVRTSAVLGLRQSDAWNAAVLAQLLREAPGERARRSVAVCLALLDSSALRDGTQWQELERSIAQQPPAIRATCYWAIAGSAVPCRLGALGERESNLELAAQIKRLLEMIPCSSTPDTRTGRAPLPTR
jgi:hypothetical protein